MSKNVDKEIQDAGGVSKNNQSTDWKWRRELARFLKTERKDEAKLTQEEAPHPKTIKLYEKETPKKIPDLDYLIRLLMLFHREKNHKASPSRLRRLFMLWIFARIEHIINNPEIKGFKREVVSDFKLKLDDPDDIESDETKIFTYYWRKSGVTVQKQVHDALYPFSKDIPSEAETIPPDSKCLPTSDSEPLPILDSKHLPTFAHFPEHFSPLTVIVGDYVGGENHEPRHFSELFRQSQSTINLHYLLQLNLPSDTEIVSDRLLLELKDDEERAKQLLGHRHLLVIGSPLVNSFSRHLILKKKLVFNFVFRKEPYDLWNDFYDDIKKTGLLDTPDAVAMFNQMMNTQGRIVVRHHKLSGDEISEEHRKEIKKKVLEMRRKTKYENMTSAKLIKKYFRPNHYFSPFESDLQSCKEEPDEAFAVVSLGENYWAENYVYKKGGEYPRRALIAVCGEDRIATAVALKALRSKHKESFQNRPLGGALKITRSGLNGPKRVTESRFNWLDKEYKASEVLTEIDHALESFDENPDAYTPLFNSKGDIETYREIVKQYTEEW
jgi:hypothetical protein